MISLLNLKNLWEWAFNLNYWIKNRIGGSPSRPFTYFQLAVVCIRRKIIQKDTKNGDYIRLDTLLPIFFSHKIATVGIKPVMCWSFQIKTWHSNNGVGAEVNVKENRIEPWVHYRRTNRIMDFFGGGGEIVTHFLIFLSLCFVHWNCEAAYSWRRRHSEVKLEHLYLLTFRSHNSLTDIMRR